jgi:hypothetical protein
MVKARRDAIGIYRVWTPTSRNSWASYSFCSLYNSILERYIRFLTAVKFMPNLNRDMYVCFSKEEILLLEEFAKKKGALNISQLLESLLKDRKNEN